MFLFRQWRLGTSRSRRGYSRNLGSPTDNKKLQTDRNLNNFGGELCSTYNFPRFFPFLFKLFLSLLIKIQRLRFCASERTVEIAHNELQLCREGRFCPFGISRNIYLLVISEQSECLFVNTATSVMKFPCCMRLLVMALPRIFSL